jgi:hypothetical protein
MDDGSGIVSHVRVVLVVKVVKEEWWREECVWVDFRGLDWWRFCGWAGWRDWGVPRIRAW